MADKDFTDGGPAFPRTPANVQGPNSIEWASQQEGMSLRDYFAGRALASLTSSATGFLETDIDQCESAAERAYRYADAMLKARSGGK